MPPTAHCYSPHSPPNSRTSAGGKGPRDVATSAVPAGALAAATSTGRALAGGCVRRLSVAAQQTGEKAVARRFIPKARTAPHHNKKVSQTRARVGASICLVQPPPPRPPAHPSQSNGPRNTKKKHMHSWHKGRSSGSPSLKKKRTGDSCATNWRMSILTASVRITGDREEKRRGGLSRTNQGVSGAASTSYPPHGLPPPL